MNIFTRIRTLIRAKTNTALNAVEDPCDAWADGLPTSVTCPAKPQLGAHKWFFLSLVH